MSGKPPEDAGRSVVRGGAGARDDEVKRHRLRPPDRCRENVDRMRATEGGGEERMLTDWNVRGEKWCQGLRRPPLSSESARRRAVRTAFYVGKEAGRCGAGGSAQAPRPKAVNHWRHMPPSMQHCDHIVLVMVPRSFCGRDRLRCDAVGLTSRNEDSMLNMQGNMYCFDGNQERMQIAAAPRFFSKASKTPLARSAEDP